MVLLDGLLPLTNIVLHYCSNAPVDIAINYLEEEVSKRKYILLRVQPTA